VNQATEIYSGEFDAIFSKLPTAIRTRITADIRDLGRRLDSFPHRRLQGRPEFRLRAGDYRVIYLFRCAAERAVSVHAWPYAGRVSFLIRKFRGGSVDQKAARE
jgi:mRNA-degrading endonuclease RelE of RelBE toxin-antitoxin system